jgi:DNA-binding MarR family transcriptional regulator
MNLARLLLERFRWFDDALRDRLAERGLAQLTTAESMVFPYLDAGGTRPAELARRLGITRQSAQTLVKGLQHHGLVELVNDPEDGRSKLIVLTAAGKRSIPIALEAFAELEAELSRRIGSDALSALRRGLEMDWGSAQRLPK